MFKQVIYLTLPPRAGRDQLFSRTRPQRGARRDE